MTLKNLPSTSWKNWVNLWVYNFPYCYNEIPESRWSVQNRLFGLQFWKFCGSSTHGGSWEVSRCWGKKAQEADSLCNSSVARSGFLPCEDGTNSFMAVGSNSKHLLKASPFHRTATLGTDFATHGSQGPFSSHSNHIYDTYNNVYKF